MQHQVVDDTLLSGAGSDRVPTIRPSAAPVLNARAMALKRSIDVAIGTLTLVLALPVCAAIGALVKLTSRGPVFFCQERVGKGGTPFQLIKFRTMRDGTHSEVLSCEQQRADYAANDFKLPPDDPRITQFGRLLRRTSLDELPQVINVLRGEMSLVGIRPLLREELACRGDYEQMCYRLMRPGMTGLWQVEGRSAVESADRRALDRRYVEEWRLLGDLKLLLLTPLAVLRVHRTH